MLRRSASGAMITSVKISMIARAASASSLRLSATMPPIRRGGSQASAFGRRSTRSAPSATPQGLACLMMTTGGGARRLEFGDALIGGIGVVDIVVRKFACPAVAAPSRRRAGVRRPVERRVLVRIFAIAQRLEQLSAEGAELRRVVFQQACEPVRDRRVIGRGARIRLGGETAAERERGRAAVGGHFVKHRRIILRLDDDGDLVVVLRRRADHRWAADVDILDPLLESRAFVDGLLERIEVDHEKIDRRDTVILIDRA